MDTIDNDLDGAESGRIHAAPAPNAGKSPQGCLLRCGRVAQASLPGDILCTFLVDHLVATLKMGVSPEGALDQRKQAWQDLPGMVANAVFFHALCGPQPCEIIK